VALGGFEVEALGRRRLRRYHAPLGSVERSRHQPIVALASLTDQAAIGVAQLGSGIQNRLQNGIQVSWR
jgi:hypothetical protein